MRLALFILSHELIRNAHNVIFHTVITGKLRVIRFSYCGGTKDAYKKSAAYKVETQNLASHKLETLLQHADYNRN